MGGIAVRIDRRYALGRKGDLSATFSLHTSKFVLPYSVPLVLLEAVQGGCAHGDSTSVGRSIEIVKLVKISSPCTRGIQQRRVNGEGVQVDGSHGGDKR